MSVRISLLGILVCLCMVSVVGAEEGALSTLPSDTPYVVEVFTSQGCSSCPAADDAISILYQQAQAADVDMYVLAWHVDYWDYLGWKDPYASSFSTKRQRDYARGMSRTTVYTPQVLVNGHAEVDNPYQSGSVIDALRTAAKGNAAISIDVRPQTPEVASVAINYTRASSLPRGAYDIGMMIVEDGIVTRPTRGENTGRRLRNNHVVRASVFKRLRGSGELTLDIPSDIVRAQSEAIVIAQHRQTRKIVFAQSVGL